jgi:hypothetical protein
MNNSYNPTMPITTGKLYTQRLTTDPP